MAQYIDKKEVEDILKKLWKTDNSMNSEHRICYNKGIQDVQIEIDNLKVKDDTELETMLSELPETIPEVLSNQVYQMAIYHFDSQWHVDYVGELDGDSLCCFSGDTLYEAVEKAWNKLRNE